MNKPSNSNDYWGRFGDVGAQTRYQEKIDVIKSEITALGALHDPQVMQLLTALEAAQYDPDLYQILQHTLQPYRTRNLIEPDPLRPYPGSDSGLDQGSLEVGTIRESELPWRIPEDRLPHMLISGMTESGKTSLALGLLEQTTLPFLLVTLKSDIGHLLFDPPIVRQALRFSELRLSLFAPPGNMVMGRWFQTVVDLLVRDLGLQYGRSLLIECGNELIALYDAYAQAKSARHFFTLGNLLEMVRRKGRKNKYADSTAAALEMACNALGNRVEYSQGWDPLAFLLSSQTALAMDSIPHANAARFLIDVLLEYIHASLIAVGPNSGSPQFLVVLDDGHRYMAKSNDRNAATPLSDHLLIVRQSGLRYALITQSPSDIAHAVLSQSGIIIQVGPMAANDDVFTIAGGLGLQPSAVEHLKQTSHREFVARENLGRYKLPFGGHVRPLLRRGIQIPEAQRIACMKPIMDALPSHPAIPLADVERALGIPLKGAVPAATVSPKQTDAGQLGLDILRHPWDFLSARYTRLGFSGGKGNAAKQELIDTGQVKEHKVPTGRGKPSILLEPLAPLAHALNATLPPYGKGGFLHAFAQQAVANKLKATGHTRVKTEAPFGSKMVDVVGVDPSGNLVGIEVSIHLANLTDNLAKDMLCSQKKFARLVAVCMDSTKLREAQRLIMGSVELRPYQGIIAVETIAQWL